MNLKHNLEIVLFTPQIPQNTGNIGRICVNVGCKLHLVKPIGFSLEEKYIKRSGLDYWKYLELEVHEDWNAFLKDRNLLNAYFFTTKTDRSFWNCPYGEQDASKTVYLVFGSETSGLTKNMYETYSDKLYTIPMFGEHSRSYNLANSVSIVLFEGLRRSYLKYT